MNGYHEPFIEVIQRYKENSLSENEHFDYVFAWPIRKFEDSLSRGGDTDSHSPAAEGGMGPDSDRHKGKKY